MRYTNSYIEKRIATLKTKPVENTNLIRKWERYLRRVESK